MTEERWPGEDRMPATDEEPGTEAPEPEPDVAPVEEEHAEADGESAPPEEQLEGEAAEPQRDGDTPMPDDEPPAEEDELPRLRGPGHAPGQLSVPDGYGTRLGLQSLERRVVPASFTVSNTNDAGTGSLRQAILSANAASGADTKVELKGTHLCCGACVPNDNTHCGGCTPCGPMESCVDPMGMGFVCLNLG